jgi:hypothetical protein
MSTALTSMVRAGLEGFVNPEDSVSKKDAYVGFAAQLIAFVLALVILSLVGKLLWNGVIVDLFSFAKPARSYWQILGLFVFTSLLY